LIKGDGKMNSIKPVLSIEEVKSFLEESLKGKIEQLEEIKSGKIKAVYSFEFKGKGYVIRFSQDDYDFKIEKYLQQLFEGQEFAIPKTIFTGKLSDLYCDVSERIQGKTLRNLKEEEIKNVIPSIMTELNKLHSLDASSTKGYGFYDESMNGTFPSFIEFLEDFFSNEQHGFWYGWHELFNSNLLDKEIFEQLYKKMMEFAPYCEGRRHIVHSDFHFDNVIIDDSKVKGIIDWGRTSYMDYVFDITTLVMEFPEYNLLEQFEDYYRKHNMDTSNLKERFLCAAICSGLDGMRFWTKLGHEASCNAILINMLRILNQNGIRL
jgi:hygromycin-B 4-O-kinase